MVIRLSNNFQSRGGQSVLWVVVHTSQGDNPANVFPDYSAENLANWMESNEVSYHVVVDDDSYVRIVNDDNASWSILGGNNYSLNICAVGKAEWTLAEWQRHPWMLNTMAGIVREWCIKYGLPMVKLTPAEVGNNQKGVIGHIDYTIGKHDGSHTDPGPNFPWPDFINAVNGADDVSADDVWHGVVVTNIYGQKVHAIDIINAAEAKLDQVLAKLDHLLVRLEETATGIIAGYTGTLDAIKKDADPIKAELDAVLRAVLQIQNEVSTLVGAVKTPPPA